MADHDIIIQGTPVGMYPRHEGTMCIPEGMLRRSHIVLDMVYRPLKTTFIQEAEAAGCTAIRGSEMLVHQAALQFEAWTGMAAPVAVMRQTLLGILNSESG